MIKDSTVQYKRSIKMVMGSGY